jgi:methyl-accepting chemotaxis protein
MATWEELNRVETALRDLSDEVERSSSALAQEGSRRAASIHGRVDKLSGLVERLDERTETTNATVAELNRKIDLLLQKK